MVFGVFHGERFAGALPGINFLQSLFIGGGLVVDESVLYIWIRAEQFQDRVVLEISEGAQKG